MIPTLGVCGTQERSAQGGSAKQRTIEVRVAYLILHPSWRRCLTVSPFVPSQCRGTVGSHRQRPHQQSRHVLLKHYLPVHSPPPRYAHRMQTWQRESAHRGLPACERRATQHRETMLLTRARTPVMPLEISASARLAPGGLAAAACRCVHRVDGFNKEDGEQVWPVHNGGVSMLEWLGCGLGKIRVQIPSRAPLQKVRQRVPAFCRRLQVLHAFFLITTVKMPLLSRALSKHLSASFGDRLWPHESISRSGRAVPTMPSPEASPSLHPGNPLANEIGALHLDASPPDGNGAARWFDAHSSLL